MTTTANKQTPAARWDLHELDRVTVDGAEYAVYTDGAYVHAIEASAWDAPTEEGDYSTWCADTPAVSDPDVARRILVESDACDEIQLHGDLHTVRLDDD